MIRKLAYEERISFLRRLEIRSQSPAWHVSFKITMPSSFLHTCCDLQLSQAMGIAEAPATVTYQTDLVNGLLHGDSSGNVAAATAVAVLYGLLMLVALFNFFREHYGSHLLLTFFGASKTSIFQWDTGHKGR